MQPDDGLWFRQSRKRVQLLVICPSGITHAGGNMQRSLQHFKYDETNVEQQQQQGEEQQQFILSKNAKIKLLN